MNKDKRRRERTPVNRRAVVGDTVTREAATIGDDKRYAITMRGTVVYVHPRGRFHVVEFPSGIRESFSGVMLLPWEPREEAKP